MCHILGLFTFVVGLTLLQNKLGFILYIRLDIFICTGLLTEPGNKAMSVSIWGFGKVDRKWRVFTVDFEKVIQRQCEYTYSMLITIVTLSKFEYEWNIKHMHVFYC